jgi:hypothetical protein
MVPSISNTQKEGYIMTVQQLIEKLQDFAEQGCAEVEVRGEHYCIEEVICSSNCDAVILH